MDDRMLSVRQFVATDAAKCHGGLGEVAGAGAGAGKGQRQEQGIKKRQPVIAGLTSGDSIVQRKDNPSLLPLLLPLPLFLTADAA